jgi:hypothetical protein
MPKVSIDEARANANGLLDFWQAGFKSLARLNRLQREAPNCLHYPHKHATYADEAKRAGIGTDTLAKARRLAREYTKQEICDLCADVKKHCVPFSQTHMLRLLAVKPRSPRDRLIKQAITHGWTVRQLERAAQGLRGSRRPHVGRRPQLPNDETELVMALEALCLRWRRWTEAARPRLPVHLHKPLDAAAKAVRRLQRMTQHLQKPLPQSKQTKP